MSGYDGKQFVGIDLHRQRSVIVRQTDSGEQLSAVRIVNDPVALGLQLRAIDTSSLPAGRDCAHPGAEVPIEPAGRHH